MTNLSKHKHNKHGSETDRKDVNCLHLDHLRELLQYDATPWGFDSHRFINNFHA